MTIIAAPPLMESTFPPALPPVNCGAASAPPSQCRGHFRGLRHNVGQFGLVPPAAERDDEVHGVGLELRLGRQQRLFRRKLLRLGDHHRGERLGAGAIFVERDLGRLPRDANVLRLHLDLLRQDANSGETVLDLLDRGQDGLAVGRDLAS